MSPAHKKLLGVWRSDKRKTLQTLHRYHCLPEAKKRKLGALFGKLQLRYTGKYLYCKLGDFEYKERYDVVAEDEESIVVRIYSDGIKNRIDDYSVKCVPELFTPRLQQIHFRRHRGRRYYWIGLGKYCEWFQRQGIQ
jgi:hypothetical protein